MYFCIITDYTECLIFFNAYNTAFYEISRLIEKAKNLQNSTKQEPISNHISLFFFSPMIKGYVWLIGLTFYFLGHLLCLFYFELDCLI